MLFLKDFSKNGGARYSGRHLPEHVPLPLHSYYYKALNHLSTYIPFKTSSNEYSSVFTTIHALPPYALLTTKTPSPPLSRPIALYSRALSRFGTSRPPRILFSKLSARQLRQERSENSYNRGRQGPLRWGSVPTVKYQTFAEGNYYVDNVCYWYLINGI